MAPTPRPSATPGRPLRGLSERIPDALIHGAGEAVVTGITHDSREVRPGDIYVARAGERAHGIAFVGDAVAAGAVAVLTDPLSAQAALAAGADAVVEVADPRAAAGPAAAWVYGDPAADLDIIG